MLELTPASAADYLRARGIAARRVVELADGVSNAVLRVETDDGPFVLKQSRPQLRTREAWFSDIGRIWRERDAMLFLRPLLPAGVVPEVLFSDDANFAFAMSHAPQPLRNWRTVLLSGEVDLKLGELAGSILGGIHRESARRDLTAFADRTVFEQLRVEPFYRRIRDRLTDVGKHIDELIDRCHSIRTALCHGDFSPKNLLRHAAGFTLVDYETCHWGDAAFDLGFFVSHLILKSVQLPEHEFAFHNLVRAFARGYADTTEIAPGLLHLGACLLARVDGTSPAPYLVDEAKRERVRAIGRTLLRERPRTWDQVIGLLAHRGC